MEAPIAMPDGRGVVVSFSMAAADSRARITARFVALGIAADRLILEGHSPVAEGLAAYNRVDIALDP